MNARRKPKWHGMGLLLATLLLSLALNLPGKMLFAAERTLSEYGGKAPQRHGVTIGDPMETFLREKKQDQVDTTPKRPEPKNFDEFWSYVKSDLQLAQQEFIDLPDELKKVKKNSFVDPDFTPPPRPDWR